ncbi:MAG: peptidoglycan DD-metalloendopeptidase family protein [Acidimicrobiia bacterium]|nr:peptidoglycan DD-metalloendopeptidase family protein [Acidimicrobiia bacterium]
MRTLLRFIGALLLVALVAVPAFGQVSPEDIAQAEAELVALRAEADQLAVEYEAAFSRSAQLETQVAGLEAAIQDSQIQLGMTRQLVRERAVEMYIESSTSQLSLLFVQDLDGGFEVALNYLEELGSSDTELLRDLEVIKTGYERQLSELQSARSEQEAVVAELSSVGTRLIAQLESAQIAYVALVAQRAAEERVRAEEEARRRAEEAASAARAAAAATTTLAPTTLATTTTNVATTTTNVATTTTNVATTTTAGDATTTTIAGDTTTTTTTTTTSSPQPPATGQTCPVDGFTSFTDTWGAPRSGGRSHQGVDMLGARWTPLVAIESGTILRTGSGGLGGISIWLKGTSGDQFYYGHLEAWADGLRVGQSVQAGELIGYMGTSGNAPDYVPHLHFEYHPGGGAAANPYPLVKGLCG